MPKHLRKTIQRPPHKSAVPIKVMVGGGILVAVSMFLVFRWVTSRVRSFHFPYKNFFQIPGRKKSASDKQMRYLEHLLSEQNFFRSNQVSLNELLEKEAKAGIVSTRQASGLIKKLKAENETLKSEFDYQKKFEGVGRFRGEIHVTDIHSFAYCERAAHYSVLQYPRQNLIDLGTGKRIHRAFSDSENRDSAQPARINKFINQQEPSVASVERLKNSAEANLRHPSLPLTGRPDGYFHYLDGTKAVFELKTVTELPSVPRDGDFIQVDIYALLASAQARIRNESFVLYMHRSTHELALHKRKRALTEYDLAQIVAKIERGARSIEGLRVTNSAKKCASCSFRSICSGKIGS
jgi:CRISPR/Cas system-associated exonuclease Cas4 (RecB family)